MKDLPDFVFNKEYENYYLLSEDQDFSIRKEIFNFSSRIGGKEILVDIRNLSLDKKYKQYQFSRLTVSPNTKFSLFDTIVGQDLFLESLIGHYYISDNTHQWEYYCSVMAELCVFACNNEVKDIYEELFNPYGESTIKTKLDMLFFMVDEKKKNEFVEKLYKNYHWK